MKVNLKQINEMTEHIRLIKAEPGTERARSSANAVGFFFEELKSETEDVTDILPDNGEIPFFLNLTR